MRCNNCGWDNSEDLIKCEKCNAPMKGSMVRHKDSVPDVPSGQPISGTVKGGVANLPYLDEAANVEKNESKQQLSEGQVACIECDYPVSNNAIKCPNCGKILDKSRKESPREEKTMVSGTVSPWDKPKHSKCFLKPIARDGEKEFQDLEFSGDEVDLNRENLEQNNMTITSQVQAVLQNKDGKWYLENKSSLQTTFVLVTGSIELKDGDIILMGDRKFEFGA